MNDFLFLDDIRNPVESFDYTKEKMFLHEKWCIVRSYVEFVDWIKTNGLPCFISFDHDLADIHYAYTDFWDDYYDNPEELSFTAAQEKTGYDCAKWLVEYCLDNGLECPDFYCHSMNPVGRRKILDLLDSFRNRDE